MVQRCVEKEVWEEEKSSAEVAFPESTKAFLLVYLLEAVQRPLVFVFLAATLHIIRRVWLVAIVLNLKSKPDQFQWRRHRIGEARDYTLAVKVGEHLALTIGGQVAKAHCCCSPHKTEGEH